MAKYTAPMSTSKTPIERYKAMLIFSPPGRPQCRGWAGKISHRDGLAHFTWTDERGYYRTGNAARWSWVYHRGPLDAEERLHNTCGWKVCQRLDHWEVRAYLKGRTAVERYEAKIDRSGGPDACHDWQERARDKNGYGLFSVRVKGRLITWRAHRFGWEQHYGPIPPGMVICHTCDRPPCQNPTHWFLGTHADNHADMTTKGRARAVGGEAHHRSRLTDREIREVRNRYTGERGQTSALAREYGVAPRTMSRILRGERRSSA